MSNDEGSEDRLTKGEFAELIQHLSVQEILTIEYRIGTNWNKLFARKNVSSHTFVCNLCVLETSSFKSLLSHIDGRKHRLQMDRVKQLYHPDYTYPKTEKKVSLENAVIINSEKDVPSTSTQSASKCNTDQDNSENKSLRTTSSGINVNTNNTTKILTDCEKQNEKIENKTLNNEINYEKEIRYLQTKSQNDSEKNESLRNDKEKAINFDSNNKEIKINPVIGGKRSLSDDKTQVETDVKKNKIVINPAAALSMKASAESTNDVTNHEDSKEKPRYQTGKIIIPTVHKNKSCNDKDTSRKKSEERANDLPKFSVKSYSSKPNDNDIHGILGVEYVIKILKSRNDNSPRYECGLCELVLDGFAMQKHLEGYNHRLKFCEKHFPTAIRHYRQYMQNVPESELFKVMTPVLAKLSVAIEQHHGRNLPYECYERDFNLNRHEILAKAFSCRHASEQYGPTFTHVVSSKEIDEFINNRNNYLPPSSSRSAIFDKKPGSSNSRYDSRTLNPTNSDNEFNSRHRHAGRENILKTVDTQKSYMSSGLHDEMYPPSSHYNQAGNVNLVQQVDDETYNLMVDDFLKGTLKGISGNNKLLDHRKRSKSPGRNANSSKRKSLSPLRQNDIWQAYRHMVDQELYNLDERFKQYRNDPETHPSYNEEWQKFWKRRKDELVSAGLDHRKYNYQPEWVRFIKIRIEELYGQEVENVKIKARERLCLPMSNENVLDEKYQVQAPKIIASNDPTGLAITSKSQSPTTDNVPQVVPVLRLMTALEDSLGSLGPKIIDLLSKALQAEKTNPSYVNAIILNDENCSLIETAKEKFKGLIITGLFEGSKKRVLKQVVNDTEVLLKYAYQYRQLLVSQRSTLEENSINQTQLLESRVSTNIAGIIQNQSTRSQTLSSSSKSENMLTRGDKKELASKLAASLVAQGKTDFDPQQLQQLIAVYKLIEKKKRESGGSGLTNKTSLTEPSSSSKKTLSDTLSELLKSSNSNDPRKSKTPQSTSELSSQMLSSQEISPNNAFPQNNSRNPIEPQNFIHSNTLTSVLQNPNDNYFNNTASSMTSAYVDSARRDNLMEQQSNDYGMNTSSHHQNSNFANMYNNQYQNINSMTQNWGWNSNIPMNQNYNMGAPNSYNQNNWQHF